MPRPFAALIGLSLIAAAPAAAPVAAAAAPDRAAECSIAAFGTVTEGPCRFTGQAGGSFTVAMSDGHPIAGMAGVAVDIAGDRGKVRGAGGAAHPLGAVQRDPRDPACWSGEGLRVCARDAKPVAPAPEPTREIFVSRCHMNFCGLYAQSAPRQIGEGSAAVPGRLMAVTERRASRDYPEGDYPAVPPADLNWGPPSEAQYFCSATRPAVRGEDGEWLLLPLPQVFGATEGATNAYLHVCHPDKVGADPYAAAEGLSGYDVGEGVLGNTYPDFAALIR